MSAGIRLRAPCPEDGADVGALIASCPPLDRNSLYATLLLCSDFADSCVVAEEGARLVGWVSGYRRPVAPADFFVWQVAVAPAARGRGLAGRMIEALLHRPQATGVRHLVSTITAGNGASWALFEGLARRWRAPLERSPRFDRDRHLAGAHDSEWQARIGPLPRIPDPFDDRRADT